MRREDQEALWSKLEWLCLIWRDLGPADSAVRTSLNFELTSVLMELFPGEGALEALGAFWLMDINRYDPQKGSFRGFFKARLKLRKEDMDREDGIKPKGGQKDEWRVESLDASIGEDQEETKIGRLEDETAVSGQGELEAEERARELIALILLLPQRLSGKANNPTRVNYFRMFFTDGSVAVLFDSVKWPYLAHERDLFAAMKLPFLDFFMKDTCRSVEDILRSDLKEYGRMVKGQPMTVPRQPLPNDVYVEYLNTQEGMELKSVSVVSNQRKAYVAFLKENLC